MGLPLAAQNLNISGTVLDGNNDPVVGATVVVKGSTAGTTTGVGGNYDIQAPPDGTLVFTLLGMAAHEEAIGGRARIDVLLSDDAQAIDEVVVVGFGSQKKVNLTGAVGIATTKDIADRPVISAVQALQGIVPGLSITQNSGNLDAGSTIKIRGRGTIDDQIKGDPLILIDGMEGDINALNPADIETMSVLKDAAASSIYGAKASFGVILITTKSGKAGKT
ncbi:hypothetical protein FACS1894156_0120 [Bacteroidia bacterium]|nr:hypothetical protein FACS1894156_0120 [Bacteroidia bacterium]